MKKTLFTLLAISGIHMLASGQVITSYPGSLHFTAPGSSASAPQTVTITASGLATGPGYVIVTPNPKFIVSLNGTTYSTIDSIPYSGTTLAATTVYVEYVPPEPGYLASGSVSFAGGGAAYNLCVCANDPNCPCVPARVATVQNEPTITIAPNPAVNELTINSTSRITTVAISNLIGKTVYAHNFNSENVQVNVAGLPDGIYIVRINDTEVRRFVKQ